MSLEGSETAWGKQKPVYNQLEMEEPESEAGAQAGYIEREVKDEPKWESETAAQPDLYPHHEADEPETEVGAQAVCIKREVKEEPELASEESVSGIREVVVTSPYTGQTVKEEVVVGPEEVHRPKVELVYPGSFRPEERNDVGSRSCSVILEAMHVDLKRHTCIIGLQIYKFRLYLNNQQDNNTRKDYNSSNSKLSSKSQLIHVKEHTGDKPYKCTHCSFASDHRNSLYVHMKIHSSKKRYNCAHCSYSSVYKSSLSIHLKTHTGDKPYKCEICSYSSAQKSALKLHIRTHTGEKPYKCAHCTYSSARKRDLQIHSITHTADKPYKCDHCSYSNASKYLTDDSEWKMHLFFCLLFIVFCITLVDIMLFLFFLL